MPTIVKPCETIPAISKEFFQLVHQVTVVRPKSSLNLGWRNTREDEGCSKTQTPPRATIRKIARIILQASWIAEKNIGCISGQGRFASWWHTMTWYCICMSSMYTYMDLYLSLYMYIYIYPCILMIYFIWLYLRNKYRHIHIMSGFETFISPWNDRVTNPDYNSCCITNCPVLPMVQIHLQVVGKSAGGSIHVRHLQRKSKPNQM